MSFKQKYLESTINTIMKIHPEYNREDVEKIILRNMKERIKDPSINLDNNVTGENINTTLTYLCNWIDSRNPHPVVSGNATFYCQPTELLSPTSNMLRALKKGRKEVKKEMFKYDPKSDEYDRLDLDQNNKKVIMNAEYGGSGAPTAAFYTKYSPAATTLLAQSIITTMAAFFESFVGDNQKFFNINECVDWMNHVVQKNEKIHKWIKVPTKMEVAHRIKLHFYMPDINKFQIIDKYIEQCNESELVYLYYANNLNEFIYKHPEVYGLIANSLQTLPLLETSETDVPDEYLGKFDDVKDYNKWVAEQMFLDPYNVPASIKDIMDKFIDLVYQYVFVEYITPDSIVKLNNHKRNTVLLVDTDSNVIYANQFVSFVLDNIFMGTTFGRSRLYNDMIITNTLAVILDKCIKQVLDYYGRCHNMDKESRSELTMKNEFMFRRLFLMLTKKRYAASIVLREGNMMLPFKLEIKGMDFIKAGVTDEVTKKFTNMLKDHILTPEEPQLQNLMRDVKRFEKDIYKNLREGGTKYLKSQQYKPEEGYSKIKDASGKVVGSKAWQLPVFRGSEIWNLLYPENKIYSLDRVSILKLIVTSQSDLDRIKDKFPEDYNNVISKIYCNNDPNIIKAGMKVICIPSTVRNIPDWLIPLIDYDVTISDTISSFKSVSESLKIEGIEFKTPNGKANVTSCLISL